MEKKHDEILGLMSNLLRNYITDTNFGEKRGIDLIMTDSNEKIGIEIKTLPPSWIKQVKNYKKRQNLDKIIIVVDIPNSIDEVYGFRKNKVATKLKDMSKIFEYFVDYINRMLEHNLQKFQEAT